MKKSFPQRGRTVAFAGGLALAGALLSQGCLKREVEPQKPNTSNVFVEQIANSAINQIDLLFVIDNSVSMADKQDILQKAVPQMVERLVTPQCVDDDGNPVGASADANGVCATGNPEFKAVEDIHIGVISSSLGGHGSTSSCQRVLPDGTPTDNDDQGHLIPFKRDSVTNKGAVTANFPGGAGFLAWAGGSDADRDNLIVAFSEHVGGTGEAGCGYEAPLEAWYRFLVDPSPPLEMEVLGNTGSTVRPDASGNTVDQSVLSQRDDFLRPQGLVAIVVLTDENDCSVMDGGLQYANAGFGYLVTDVRNTSNNERKLLPIATSVCATNPNDKCCFSCLTPNGPSGCESVASECSGTPRLEPANDRTNARCFENKRRFGIDLLYPTSRYVDALTKAKIIDDRSGETVDNPLLRGTRANPGKPRGEGLVFFAGIVGVPWQNIATDESLSNAGTMRYRTAFELAEKDVNVSGREVDRWEVILGSPGLSETSSECDEERPGCGEKPRAPLDPFMIESIAPRIGNDVYGNPIPATNPISGDAIVDATSEDPAANNINGHEAQHDAEGAGYDSSEGPANDDLQYACIFPLATDAVKMNCDPNDSSCDCGTEPDRNRPLCQPPAGGTAGTTQYFGKAYPGTRILQVLKDFGDNSIVGSICPKIVDEANPDFGYNPAVQAIVDRLAEKLSGKCLPRELTIDEDGNVPCAVIEAKPAGAEPQLDCAGNGRGEVDADIRPAVEKQLEETGFCGGESGISCETYKMCEIIPLAQDTPGRATCLTNTNDPTSFPDAGYCYIDPAKGPAAGGEGMGCDASDPSSFDRCDNPIVSNCAATERRLLRFVGEETPARDSITFVACTGDAASSDSAIPPASPASMGGSAP